MVHIVDNTLCCDHHPTGPSAAPEVPAEVRVVQLERVGSADRAAQRAAHDVDDLIHVPVGLAVLGRRADTALDVVLEHQDRQRIDRGPQGGGLLQDVDAVLLALDHPGDAADLTLHPRQAAHELGLVLRVAVAEVTGVHGLRPHVVRSDRSCHRSYPPGVSVARRTGRSEAPIRLHLAPMHPGDRLGPIPDGVTCTACGASVPAEWIRILAHRDDLAFVELDCTGLRQPRPRPPARLGRARRPAVLDVAERPACPPAAISAADVAAMRDYLAGWDGDLHGLLADGR